MPDRPRFGPAGFPSWFKKLNIATSEFPSFLQREGLSALEYEAVRWGRKPQIMRDEAERLGRNAEKHDVWLSIHGSYYINLLGNQKKLEASKERLLACATAAQWMKSHTIAFHLGYYTQKQSHKKDLQSCMKTLQEIANTMKSMSIKVKLGPETSGKLAQLGSLEEVLTICENVEQTQPVIDWAHLHARQRGNLRTVVDFRHVIEEIENRLGTDATKNLHCHFSHVEYTFRGERRHQSLDASRYGPKFELLAETIIREKLKPIIISESPFLDDDAKKMRDIFCRKLEAL